MTTISQIRGMLLEEAVLQLLRTAGYTTVDKAGTDPTLQDGPSGLEVLGRGGKHQIDAVADFCIEPPFTHPQRLIVEAKCYSSQPTGLPIIRNAVGVLKDISEYWVPSRDHNGIVTTGRYHYQYAVFSASGYSSNAERYAFAQDIYLIQYERSRYMAPVIQAIRHLNYTDFGARAWNAIDVNMTDFRLSVRHAIRTGSVEDLTKFDFNSVTLGIKELVQSIQQIKGTLLAVAGRRFPIHLIPAPLTQLDRLRELYHVRIRWDAESWYLTDAETHQDLFSFDLPPELFRLYADHGNLTESGALDLKSDVLNRFQAVLTLHDESRLITFILDRQWIKKIREQIRGLPRRDEAEAQPW